MYTPGAYGNFLSWCCSYFGSNLISKELPMNDLGNFHNYSGWNVLSFPPDFKNYTEDPNAFFPIIHIHEDSFDSDDFTDLYSNSDNWINVLRKNLSYLQEHYKKSVYVYGTPTSKIWLKNNMFYKIRAQDWFKNEDDINALRAKGFADHRIAQVLAFGDDRIKHIISTMPEMTNTFAQWGHQTIDEFDQWDLRELLSYYYYDVLANDRYLSPSEESVLSQDFPNIKFIRLDSLRDNFYATIIEILNYFEIPTDKTQDIHSIYESWLPLQKHINKDNQIKLIVDAVVNRIPLDWSRWNISLFDEFIIQRILRDQGISIKCFGLNVFPTDTNTMINLIE